jgi:hypothetical protein
VRREGDGETATNGPMCTNPSYQAVGYRPPREQSAPAAPDRGTHLGPGRHPHAGGRRGQEDFREDGQSLRGSPRDPLNLGLEAQGQGSRTLEKRPLCSDRDSTSLSAERGASPLTSLRWVLDARGLHPSGRREEPCPSETRELDARREAELGGAEPRLDSLCTSQVHETGTTDRIHLERSPGPDLPPFREPCSQRFTFDADPIPTDGGQVRSCRREVGVHVGFAPSFHSFVVRQQVSPPTQESRRRSWETRTGGKEAGRRREPASPRSPRSARDPVHLPRLEEVQSPPSDTRRFGSRLVDPQGGSLFSSLLFIPRLTDNC